MLFVCRTASTCRKLMFLTYRKRHKLSSVMGEGSKVVSNKRQYLINLVIFLSFHRLIDKTWILKFYRACDVRNLGRFFNSSHETFSSLIKSKEFTYYPFLFCNLLVLHCNKTEGEIPVPTPGAAGAQRSTTGKYFPYESGVNTCFSPEVF